MHEDPTFQQLQREAHARKIGVYLSNKERRRGNPCIFLMKRETTLAEFHQPEDALAWLTAGEGRA